MLRWLDYADGGVLIDCKYDGIRNVVSIGIEHPDMPKFEKGDTPTIVSPLYITHSDAMGHKVSIRERKCQNNQ
jgi:hypothetical protein